jgi:hypothetical protein
MRTHPIARTLLGAAITATAIVSAPQVLAAEPDRASDDAHVDTRQVLPITAYTYNAAGAPRGSFGAYGYGLGLVGGQGQRPVGGGGVTAWAAPVDRLTLIADGTQDLFGNFAPSAAIIARLYGDTARGWSVGALGKFKVEGFGIGPNHEVESEIESGILLSYARNQWHVAANAIAGFGTGDDGEIDTECRFRVGRDIGQWLRLGIDSQLRYRVAGDQPLLGGRVWDFAGGGQAVMTMGNLFGALTAGPATMGIERGVGASAIATFGGTIL